MSAQPVIDPSWHPLVTGCPPAWASEWGQDRHGVFIAFTLDEVTQRLRWIPPGRFLMGSPEEETRGLAKEDHEREWFESEHPRHPVFITQGFWLFDTSCTQALWAAVMGGNPSEFKSLERPVENVSWEDVQGFMQRLNARIPGLDLGLPSEAQWEHACRAGTETALYAGPIEILGDANAPALDPIAWYGGNSNQGFELENGQERTWLREMQYPGGKAGTHPVKGKQPNAWGLYDMLGNVWEWCADGSRDYGEDYAIDPVGPLDTGAVRVVRGGSWNDVARYCRCAFRDGLAPDVRDFLFGFRCARAQGL
jgi:formylglycine-generating enzyme required for sulfatase activity